jgi:hypothetical protein
MNPELHNQPTRRVLIALSVLKELILAKDVVLAGSLVLSLVSCQDRRKRVKAPKARRAAWVTIAIAPARASAKIVMAVSVLMAAGLTCQKM